MTQQQNSYDRGKNKGVWDRTIKINPDNRKKTD